MDELAFLSATAAAERIRNGSLSPVELVDHLLDRIERLNPVLNAFVNVVGDEARAAAKNAEQLVANGTQLGPLHGVPIAIKDLLDFREGMVNTFGCGVFKDFVSPYTVAYIQRLEDAGAIILGKTNTPELGHKGLTDNTLFGPTPTPFSLSHNAGGSSGGSSAAVAAGLVPLAQGSDAGGSVRIPASCCGVVGYKATFGRIPISPRPNAFGTQTPYIHAGPIARSVQDTALMLSVMAGHDRRDPMSLPDDGADYIAAAEQSIKGKRIAISMDFGVFAVEDSVARIIRDALPAFEEAGAEVNAVDVCLPLDQDELAQLWLRQIGVAYAEIFYSFKQSGVDLLGDHRDELCPELIAVAEMGPPQSALDHRLDDWKRTLVYDSIESVFDTYDLLITPTLTTPPPPNGQGGRTLGPATVNGKNVERSIGWCMTHPINFTGHPAVSVPAGLTPEGLPVGLQIIGRRFADVDLIAAAAALERMRPWHQTYETLEPKLLKTI